MNGSPVEFEHFTIFMPPGVGPSVVRIRESDDAGLVSVVKCRSSDKCHLDDDCFSHDRRIDILSGGFAAMLRHSAYQMVSPGQEPRMIMVVQLIHRTESGRSHETGKMVTHGALKGFPVTEQILAEFIAVLLHSGQEPGHRFHESVVIHHGIPLITEKPLTRLSIVFGQNNSLRIGFLHSFSELPPEIMVIFQRMPEIRSHIETPSVHIVRRGYPLLADTHDIIEQFRTLLII